MINIVKCEGKQCYNMNFFSFTDGLIYWSRKKIETNKRIRENNQRSLLQPKFEEEYDAHAIEATSYALLVYLIREGVTFDQNRIVDWLNAMRLHDGGFTSTVVCILEYLLY